MNKLAQKKKKWLRNIKTRNKIRNNTTNQIKCFVDKYENDEI